VVLELTIQVYHACDYDRSRVVESVYQQPLGDFFVYVSNLKRMRAGFASFENAAVELGSVLRPRRASVGWLTRDGEVL
jgi:hypothetical protein